jgi:hypothetical protein
MFVYVIKASTNKRLRGREGFARSWRCSPSSSTKLRKEIALSGSTLIRKRDLDRVTSEIRNESVDPSVVSAAADRVWARVSAADQTEVQVPAIAHIEGCEDFQSLIPAYLNGKLSEARSLLLVDHTHECIPCRKAMNEARSRRHVVTKEKAKAKRFTLQPVVALGIAAAVIVGLTGGSANAALLAI